MRTMAVALLLNLLVANSFAADKPNIILIITDDQGYGELACHGNPILRTPNIDRLHSESVRFTRFQVSPTCAPTRAALMSGRHEFKCGVTHTIYERERMALGIPTIAETLRAAGYATGVSGKWHLGDQDPYRPDRRGFDEVFIHGAGGIGQSYEGSCGDAPDNEYFDPYILHNDVFEKTKGFCTDVFFGQATRWIEANKDRPFFAYIPLNAAHGPFISPPKYEKIYLDKGLAKTQANFYGMIENIDDNVGALMEKLRAWDIEDNTLVIFMTDNGRTGNGGAGLYNAGMKGEKGSPHEGGTRVPCFFRWKGKLPEGVDVDRVAAHIDMFPTLAELAGATIPPDAKLDGRSLVPLLQNAKADWKDRYLITHVGRWPHGKAKDYKYVNFSVRSQRFRLVTREQLYDMESDPGQTTNVIERHPEIVAEMMKAYDAWWEEVLPLMVNENSPLEGPNTFHAMFRKQYGK
ncbi:MAG: arylsulfatase [Pirellulales bacterium]